MGSPKRTVAIRELKANLSAYVRRATAGERIEVTSHGKTVAMLGPLSLPASRGEAYERMVAEGRVTPPRKPLGKKWVGDLKKLPKLPEGTAKRILDELREDKR